jgi:DNA-binding MarR family transcriptional regulator
LLANVALFDDFELMLKDISKIVGTSSQNTKKIVNILVDKEYMIVKKEETDGRVLRIALTDNGKKYYEMRAEKEFQYLEALFDGLNDEAISSLYDGLRQFSQVIRRNKE